MRDWMKHWLMLQGYTALNTMYRKTLAKQTTFMYPKGNEKHIDCIITKRRHLKYNKDAEANDMIHMDSDHRSVMATFMINTPKKSSHCKLKKRKLDTNEGRDQTEKNIEVEMPELEKRYQEIIEKSKKNRRHKKAAAQARSENAEAQAKNDSAEAETRHDNAEAEAEEDERLCTGSMMNDSVETASRRKASWTSCTPHSERRRRSHRVQQRSCRTRHERRPGRRMSPWRLQE